MESIFLEITIVVVIASVLSILFRMFKQPGILAYILTGILLGPLAFMHIENRELLAVMGQIGVTFLLFMLGLELKIEDLKSVGKTALILGVSQIAFTSIFGYMLCMIFGLGFVESLYISIALAFSSTIIIVKLLSDKKDLNSLYGKISVGFLLVQDFVAILILILLSGFQGETAGSVQMASFAIALIKAFILFSVILFLSKNIFPYAVDLIARSQETLFLFSIAWVLAMASLVSSDLVGFSVEIGGLLAGLSLANSSEHFHIVTKMKPLRDFFITMFFVSLGMEMQIGELGAILIPAIILSLFVLIGNPFIVLMIMSFMGYSSRTAFLAGLTVAQISEFSLILVFLGNRLGHVDDAAVSMVTLIGIITFTISTYLILNGNTVYKYMSGYLRVFEKKNNREKHMEFIAELKDHIVLVGAHRTGESILNALEDHHEKVTVVDFDPDIINKIKKKDIVSLFGDIVDQDIQEKIQLEHARLVISTVPDLEDNLMLLSEIKKKNKKTDIIAIAQDEEDTEILYEAGADYVVVPHMSGGMHIAQLVKSENLKETIREMKEKESSYFV
jgi:Kef-type K+ transport system membrane component KefB